ncbi:unnamed protein product [Parascedosporium putredinis]|uniref:Uncharacterized protein n=1 Tax=Parascedosporium putredinis TaxID=1442378 RepID=A0A9P1MBQ2_9PEZI|nr:unnamed protein product [Parascedosporium putredinis]CAI7996247.1 unnamed protein product [Parascedosporium putredinis]
MTLKPPQIFPPVFHEQKGNETQALTTSTVHPPAQTESPNVEEIFKWTAVNGTGNVSSIGPVIGDTSRIGGADSGRVGAMKDCEYVPCTTIIQGGIQVTTYGGPIETHPVYGTEPVVTTTVYQGEPSAVPDEVEGASTSCTTSTAHLHGTETVIHTGPESSNGPVYHTSVTAIPTGASGTVAPSETLGYGKPSSTVEEEGPSDTPADEPEQTSFAAQGLEVGIFTMLAIGAGIMVSMV